MLTSRGPEVAADFWTTGKGSAARAVSARRGRGGPEAPGAGEGSGSAPGRGPEAAGEEGGSNGCEAGLRFGVWQGTYLNLPWQCWHWSPTQPGSQTQVELTQRPEKQEPVLSHGLDWDTCA